MKEIEEVLKIDNTWLYELVLERDRKLKEQIINSPYPLHISQVAPITVEDLLGD